MKRLLSLLLVLAMLCSMGMAFAQEEAPAEETPEVTEMTEEAPAEESAEEAPAEPAEEAPAEEAPAEETPAEEPVTDGASEEPVQQPEADPAEDGTGLTASQLFSMLAGKEFLFTSGVGAWEETITISSNGSFTGRTYDADYNVTYKGSFSGTFTDVTMVSDYEYTVTVSSLKTTSFSSYTSGGTKYVYTKPRGIAQGLTFHVYLPGIKVSSLPKEFMYTFSAYVYAQSTYFTGYGLHASDGGNYGAARSGWETDAGGNWYYCGSDAEPVTGWQKISSSWYYFDDDGVMLTGLQEIEEQDGAEYLYYLGGKDSGKMQTGWKYIGADGYVTEQSDPDGNWYYFLSSGKAVADDWQKIGGSWYYFSGSGIMLTGPAYIADSSGTMRKYYFGDSGAMETGWKRLDNTTGLPSETGSWYYFGSAMYRNQWLKYNGSWYYFDTYGRMVTGPFLATDSDGKQRMYYFGESGAMETGWKQLDNRTGKISETGAWFYFGSSLYFSSWVKSGGSWYYLGANAVMQTGLQTIADSSGNEALYYLGSADSGKMQTGWKYIGDDGYVIDKTESGGHWYYFQSSGKALQDSWLKSGGSWYYFNADGRMVTGTVNINGVNQVFDDNGKWIGNA